MTKCKLSKLPIPPHNPLKYATGGGYGGSVPFWQSEENHVRVRFNPPKMSKQMYPVTY